VDRPQPFAAGAGLRTEERLTGKPWKPALDDALYEQYLLTDRNIAEGKNPHIKFKKNGGFTLSTPKQEESDAEPLQQYTFRDERDLLWYSTVFSAAERESAYVIDGLR
jgi:hypothetical protein